jgi:hypothetical protein
MSDETRVNETALQPIFSVLWEGAEKIKQLTSTLDFGSQLGLLSHRFQELEKLALVPWVKSLVLVQSGPQIAPWSSIPHLKHLLLGDIIFSVPQDSPPCSSITVLDLDWQDPKICLHFLTICPNLIEYRVATTTPRFQTRTSIDHVLISNHLMTFRHMKIFQVSRPFEPPFSRILPRLRMPVLEELGLGISLEMIHETLLPPVLSFLHHLPDSWSRLELDHWLAEAPVPVINQLFGAIRGGKVTTLRVPGITSRSFPTLLRSLSMKVVETQEVVLPGLRHLHVQKLLPPLGLLAGSSRPENLDHSLLRDVLSLVLTRRRDIKGDVFVVDIDMCTVKDSAPVQDEFRRVISEGLRIEIKVGGKLIDCLQEIYDQLGSYFHCCRLIFTPFYQYIHGRNARIQDNSKFSCHHHRKQIPLLILIPQA